MPCMHAQFLGLGDGLEGDGEALARLSQMLPRPRGTCSHPKAIEVELVEDGPLCVRVRVRVRVRVWVRVWVWVRARARVRV